MHVLYIFRIANLIRWLFSYFYTGAFAKLLMCISIFIFIFHFLKCNRVAQGKSEWSIDRSIWILWIFWFALCPQFSDCKHKIIFVKYISVRFNDGNRWITSLKIEWLRVGIPFEKVAFAPNQIVFSCISFILLWLSKLQYRFQQQIYTFQQCIHKPLNFLFFSFFSLFVPSSTRRFVNGRHVHVCMWMCLWLILKENEYHFTHLYIENRMSGNKYDW